MIKEWQAGNAAAFEALFNHHQNMVFKVACSVLGNTQESEDAVQEVFIKVHQSADKFCGEEREFSAWLRRITLNHCINRTRRNGIRWRSFEEISELGVNMSQSNPSISPATILEENEKKEEARKLLNSLNDKHYAVMVLRYYHDLSYEEIAQTLNIPIGTVRSRLFNAIKDLRESREFRYQTSVEGKDRGEAIP